MTLFRSKTHSEVWRSRWCETCFEPHEAQRRLQGKHTECPIWKKAATTDRKPPEWDRVNNTDEMERTIRCNSYASKPAQVRKNPQQAKQFEDVPLFDETPYKIDVGYVPVDGWPERPKKGKDVDHA